MTPENEEKILTKYICLNYVLYMEPFYVIYTFCSNVWYGLKEGIFDT